MYMALVAARFPLVGMESPKLFVPSVMVVPLGSCRATASNFPFV